MFFGLNGIIGEPHSNVQACPVELLPFVLNEPSDSILLELIDNLLGIFFVPGIL